MERLPQHNDAPSPKQLFELASHAVVLANEQGKLRQTNAKKARFFVPEEIEGMYESGDNQTEVRQKIAGRIGKVGFRLWSMRLTDTYWVLQPDERWQGTRSVYRFQWSDRETKLSERTTLFVPSGDPIDLMDEIDRFYMPDDVADMLHAEMEVQAVTGGDVSLLDRDVSAFSELSRSLASAA